VSLDSEPFVRIGVDWSATVPAGAVSSVLRRLKVGEYATAQVPYSDPMAELLSEMRIKSILILRDPRDVVASHAKYIRVVEPACTDGPRLLSIDERLESVLPWSPHPLTLTTRFERRVGRKGGGSREVQVHKILAGKTAQRLFGGTPTFRKGRIGDWPNHFTQEHRQAFKEITGDLLRTLGFETESDW